MTPRGTQMHTANLVTVVHRPPRCGAIVSLLLVLSVVAAGQDGGVVSNIEATISTVGDPQDGYIEVVLDGPLLDGREPLAIRAVPDPNRHSPDVDFGNFPWWWLGHLWGHLEFYRGATLVHRVDNYVTAVRACHTLRRASWTCTFTLGVGERPSG